MLCQTSICLRYSEGDCMTDNPSYIALELFPAHVSGESLGRDYKEVMAVVTDRKLYIATDDPSGRDRYIVAHEADIYDIQGAGLRTTWVVTLDDADQTKVTIQRSNGCGCGSKLRGARMFRGVPYRRVL